MSITPKGNLYAVSMRETTPEVPMYLDSGLRACQFIVFSDRD